MKCGGVCVTPFCVTPEYLCLHEEAAEIMLIIVLYTELYQVNCDLCILLLATIIGLFMNDPYSLVSSANHKRQLMSIK